MEIKGVEVIGPALDDFYQKGTIPNTLKGKFTPQELARLKKLESLPPEIAILLREKMEIQAVGEKIDAYQTGNPRSKLDLITQVRSVKGLGTLQPTYEITHAVEEAEEKALVDADKEDARAKKAREKEKEESWWGTASSVVGDVQSVFGEKGLLGLSRWGGDLATNVKKLFEVFQSGNDGFMTAQGDKLASATKEFATAFKGDREKRKKLVEGDPRYARQQPQAPQKTSATALADADFASRMTSKRGESPGQPPQQPGAPSPRTAQLDDLARREEAQRRLARSSVPRFS